MKETRICILGGVPRVGKPIKGFWQMKGTKITAVWWSGSITRASLYW